MKVEKSFIFLSPNTNRPIYVDRHIAEGLSPYIVRDFITDEVEPKQISWNQWVTAKRLNEMEVLAWAAE